MGTNIFILGERIMKRHVRDRKRRDKQIFYFIRDTLNELAQRKNIGNTFNHTLTAFTLHSMIHGLYEWYNPKGPLTIEEVSDQLIQLFFQGLYFKSGTGRSGRKSKGVSSEMDRIVALPYTLDLDLVDAPLKK
jgi:hypothetical protein